MRSRYTAEKRTLRLPDQVISYHLYRHPTQTNGQRLVLLHGAGVAGVDTWGALINCLDQWQEVLVPDLRGMGETVSPDGAEVAFTADTLVADLSALADHLSWWSFDLGGYSLGGMVAMLFKQQRSDRVAKQFLLEPALLDRPSWQETVTLRQRYAQTAELLRTPSSREGIRNFLDTISPNRKTAAQAEELAITRLALRPEGFANALDCVSQAIHHINREALVAAQGDVSSFIGGLSVEPMHQYHRDMAEGLPNWHYFLVPGTDHSLPFQKPRQVAKVMDQEVLRYREMAGKT